MNRLTRRDFLRTSSALAATSLLPGCAMEPAAPAKPVGRVIVIGGGYGGATAAKYLRMWSSGSIEVFLIERNAEFISCPLSNLVLGGTKTLSDITRGYAGLRSYGVQVLRDEATAINVEKKKVALKRIEDLPYDRLIVSPAVELMYEQIEGYDAEAQKKILTAWKAGPETVALRQQLESMRDGGVFVISIPRSPYRCPPGPYERACQAAFYFKQSKPRSKVIILDANEDVVSKPALFKDAWSDLYKGIIEYRNNSEVKALDARAMTVRTDFDTITGDVLNVLPPMRAGDIARSAGLMTGNTRWCGVDWLTMESLAHKGIHVLGDGDAQVRPHGEQPRKARRRRDHGAHERTRTQPAADHRQHLLQLRERQGSHPRRLGAPLRSRAEDAHGGAGSKRGVLRTQRTGRRIRLGVGAEYLGGYAGLS